QLHTTQRAIDVHRNADEVVAVDRRARRIGFCVVGQEVVEIRAGAGAIVVVVAQVHLVDARGQQATLGEIPLQRCVEVRGEDRLQTWIRAAAGAFHTFSVWIRQGKEPGQLAVVLTSQGLRSGETRQQTAVLIQVESQVEARQYLVVVVLVVVPVPTCGIKRRGRGSEVLP